MGDVEIVGRGLEHVLVDLLELLARAVAVDADLVIEALVSRLDVFAEAEEAAQVELAASHDLDRIEADSANRRTGDVTHSDARVERRHQQLLRIRTTIGAEQFARFVGDNLVPPSDALAAELIGLDRSLR